RRAFRCQCTDLQSGAASQPALISNHSRCMATSAIASTVAVACGVLRHILRVAPWPVFSPTPTSMRWGKQVVGRAHFVAGMKPQTPPPHHTTPHSQGNRVKDHLGDIFATL